MAKLEGSRQEPVMSAAGEQHLPPQVTVINQESGVVLTDIDIPFGRAVLIMVKWALAAIPAAILTAIIVYGSIILFASIIAPYLGIY